MKYVFNIKALAAYGDGCRLLCCQQPSSYAANALILNTYFIFFTCNGETNSRTLVVRRLVWRTNMAASNFRRQLEGYGLTTAHILYRMPDHPALLQTYVWQDYDLC